MAVMLALLETGDHGLPKLLTTLLVVVNSRDLAA